MLAASRAPYSVRPWVLWDARDPLRAVHGQADLDAVIVETPYERVRYEAYLNSLEALPLHVDAWRGAAAGRYGFIIYAHSKTEAEAEKSFLAKFSNASVAFPDGTREDAFERAVFGPSLDFYSVAAFREERYTGSLTYRFRDPRSSCRPRGTLTFADAHGRRYRFAFDLARFR